MPHRFITRTLQHITLNNLQLFLLIKHPRLATPNINISFFFHFNNSQHLYIYTLCVFRRRTLAFISLYLCLFLLNQHLRDLKQLAMLRCQACIIAIPSTINLGLNPSFYLGGCFPFYLAQNYPLSTICAIHVYPTNQIERRTAFRRLIYPLGCCLGLRFSPRLLPLCSRLFNPHFSRGFLGSSCPGFRAWLLSGCGFIVAVVVLLLALVVVVNILSILSIACVYSGWDVSG